MFRAHVITGYLPENDERCLEELLNIQGVGGARNVSTEWLTRLTSPSSAPKARNAMLGACPRDAARCGLSRK